VLVGGKREFRDGCWTGDLRGVPAAGNRLSHPPSLEEQLDVAQAEAEKHPIRYQQLAAIRFCLRTIIWQIEGTWYDTHRGLTN
jgi:hypothetical protein